MKKVFISQPMNGKTKEQIQEKQNEVALIMKGYFNEKFEILNQVINDAPKKATPLCFLGKSLELLSTADVAVFTKNWEKYRGCRIEHTCAVEYGIGIVEL